jgi:carbon-monoxide dehydrogenase medium subunit
MASPTTASFSERHGANQMKPCAFEYWRPDSIAGAIDLLTQLGDEAKVLAGGQSLVPMMSLRLARPVALVDIGALPDLSGITVTNGTVEVGGRVRHLDLERTALPGPTGRLLRRAASRIGHLPIRVRGTIGGSLAHADPAAEWCLVATALDAELVANGPAGRRVVPAADFFQGYFTTALAHDEILTTVRLPRLDNACQVGFAEFSRRAGDFAIVAAVTVLAVRNGQIQSARVGLAGVADRPVRSSACESILVGAEAAEGAFIEAVEAAAATLEPPSDIQATAEDRRDLVRALVLRALRQGQAHAHAHAERGVR